MLRAAGIVLTVALATLVGYASLTSWPDAGASPSPGQALRGDAAPALLEPATTERGISVAGRDDRGSLGAVVTVCNNMPSTVYVVTRPDGQGYRVPWGGGDLALGATPIRSFRLVYEDPIWTYVYEVTCPTTNQHYTIRTSDLWYGRVPEGFQVRRGRPDASVGGIVWFDASGTPPSQPHREPTGSG